MNTSNNLNVKKEVIKLIKDLPEDTTLEDIQYHLFVKQKLFRAESQINEGKTHPHDQVIERVKKKWFK